MPKRFTALVTLLFSIALVGAKELSLSDALESLEGTLRWDPLFQTGVIESRSHTAAFETGAAGSQALVVYDDKEVLSLAAPYFGEGGELLFPEGFVSVLRRSFEDSIKRERENLRIAAIIVDPGHGGKDPGAVGTHVLNGKTTRVQEKDVNLTVGKLLYTELQLAYPDKLVLITRADDSYPTLEDRVTIANNVLATLRDNEAIIFVSVHANASLKSKNARGFEVWYLSPDIRRDVLPRGQEDAPGEILSIYNSMLEEEYTTESILMARSIESSVGEAFGAALPSRGVNGENFYVVRNSRMPSVLVELGFVTNPTDAQLLITPDSQRTLAKAICKGIAGFVSTFERSSGFTASP